MVAEARQIRRQHEQREHEQRQQQQASAREQPAAVEGQEGEQGEAEEEGGIGGDSGEEASAAERPEDKEVEKGTTVSSSSSMGPQAVGGTGGRLPRPAAARLRHMRQPPLTVDSLSRPSGHDLLWEDAREARSAAASAAAAVAAAAAAEGDAAAARSDGMWDVAGGGGSSSSSSGTPPTVAGLRRLLWLDLHGMSQAAARMSVLRRLEVLVSVGPALATVMGTQQQQQRQGQQQQQQGSRPARRRGEAPTPGLVLVTGVGRHSRAEATGVLRTAVQELLEQQGLPATPDPANPGRLLVPWPALSGFVQAQRDAMRTDHFFNAARARYTYVAAGAAGLVAAALIVPRLGPWLG